MMLRTLTFACCATSLFLLAGCAHSPRARRSVGDPPGISVVGIGEVQGVPDVAHTAVGVEFRATTAQAAVDRVNQHMAAVIAALQAAGVPAADLQTQQLSIYFERNRPRPMPEGQAPAGSAVEGVFRASNMVSVTVRNLDILPQVLAEATRSGINQLHGIRFDIADRAPLIAQARERAMAAAKTDATQLAQLSGVELDGVLSIQDGGGGSGGPAPMMAMREMAQSAPPVERGELTIRHTVSVVYRIKR